MKKSIFKTSIIILRQLFKRQNDSALNNEFKIISKQLKQASDYQRNCKFQEAEKICLSILQKHPQNTDVLINLGKIAQQQQKYNSAISFLEKAIDTAPSNPELLNAFGDVYQLMEQYETAKGYYQDAITLSPDFFEAHNNLGNVFQDLGQLDNAIVCHKQAITLNPEYAKAHNNLGNAYLETGETIDASRCYEQAIDIKPDYPEAYNNLGLTFLTQGRLDEAITNFKQALSLKPDFAMAYNYLGDAYQELGQFEESITHFKQAVSLAPDHTGIHYNLGIVFQEIGQLEEAVSCYKKALSLNHDYTEVHNRLGTTYLDLGLLDEAMSYFKQALSLEPEHPEIHYNLGFVFQKMGQLGQAKSCYEKALLLKPDYAEAHNKLGYILMIQDRMEESIGQFELALSVKPDFADARYNLGNVLTILARLEEAFTHYKQAISIKPDFPEPYNNLGNALKDFGQLDEAISHYEKALTLNPNYAVVHSNLLYTLSYKHDIGSQELFDAHLRWAHQHALPLTKSIETHTNDARSDRCLRIGYLSPDFRVHSVAFFIMPILANHNRDKFKTIAYFDHTVDDNMTRRLQTEFDTWHNIANMSDEQVVKLIREDGIDILIDLTGHTSNNRMCVFALKPTPVQVTYLGYSTTTGLPTMDFRLTDTWTDPPGETERYHTEELVRLPHVFLCYQPPLDCPEIRNLPAENSEYITFGSFNNATKINQKVVSVWARCMQSIPESHLILKASQFNNASIRHNFQSLFEECGISPERIEFINWTTSVSDHMDLYNKIDIALDTFPYNGTTTTCEALWMGVPVITLSGVVHQARVGGSILTDIGFPQFIANTHDAFVEKTVDLANDLVTLKAVRNELRDKMRLAPLTNAKQFTQTLENAYREMWFRWCNNKESL